MIPGSNILSMALRVITPSPFSYYAFASRMSQPNGQYLSNYAAPVPLLGSVQPVPRSLYLQNGLDFDKYYLKFFVSKGVLDVSRDVSGDLMVFEGNTYQCESITAWYGIDSWVEVLCFQIQNIPLVVGITYPAAGTYNASSTLNFSLMFNMAVTVTGTPFIALSPVSGIIGGNASYTGGSGTDTLAFAYVVAPGDNAHGIVAASPVVGTIDSAASVPANASFAPPSLTGVILAG